MDLSDFQNLDQIGQELNEEEERYIESCLRIMAIMYMQMEQIIHDYPHVEEVSFSLDDGDEDSMPLFYCPTNDDDDLGEWPQIEEISESWNSFHHAGARHFISWGRDMVISRENLIEDRKRFLDQMSQSLPVDPDKAKLWAQQLDSFLIRRALGEMVKESSEVKDTPYKSKKPGM